MKFRILILGNYRFSWILLAVLALFKPGKFSLFSSLWVKTQNQNKSYIYIKKN